MVVSASGPSTVLTNFPMKKKCHYCQKLGHIQKNCYKYLNYVRTRGSGPTTSAATTDDAPDDAFTRMSQSQLAALCRQMSQTQIAPSAAPPFHMALSSTTAGVLGPGPYMPVIFLTQVLHGMFNQMTLIFSTAVQSLMDLESG